MSGFASRTELDTHIQNLSDKADVCIIGTGIELKRLGLSYQTTVYGVPCKETDRVYSTEPAPIAVSRGPVHAFGLNGQKRSPEGTIVTEDSGDDLIVNDSTDAATNQE